MRGAESSSHFFFFNDTATTEIYTLSLHDALPISFRHHEAVAVLRERLWHRLRRIVLRREGGEQRSEEHTSELQSHLNLVCRLLLEKKKRLTRVGPYRSFPDAAPAKPHRSLAPRAL